jgi:hypothetical protein
MRHTHRARQSTVAQMLDKAVWVIMLIARTSFVAAFNDVPLVPGIETFPNLSIGLPCHMIALRYGYVIYLASWIS